MNARREAGRRLVVSRRNHPERLDLAEDILNPVPIPIGVSVKGARKRSVFLRGNHRLDSVFRKPIKHGVRVTGRVADPCREIHRVTGSRSIGIATRSWLWPGRITKRINVPIASVRTTIVRVRPLI